MQDTQQRAQSEDDRHVDEAGREETADGGGRCAIHEYTQPDIVAILCIDNLVKPQKRFLKTDDVVQYFFVDLVGVFELAEVDTLGGTNDLDFSRVCTSQIKTCTYAKAKERLQDIVKRNQHAAGDVEELAVDLKHLGCGSEVLLKAMGRGAEQHQSTAHADDVLLALEDVGHVNLDAHISVLLRFHDLGQYAAAVGALLKSWARLRLLLAIRVCKFRRGTDQSSERLLRLSSFLLLVPLLSRWRGCTRGRAGLLGGRRRAVAGLGGCEGRPL